MLRLNLGCGNAKIQDCINIDVEEGVKPDLVHDFCRKELPYETNSVGEVYLFHTIEHIQKIYHRELFLEVNRVLRDGGLFYLSFPEFTKCVKNWASNFRGKRDFWEHTIYGLQRYKSDFHVCIIDSLALKGVLEECGFHGIEYKSEPNEEWNTVFKATKSIPYISYEELVMRDMNVSMGRAVDDNGK
jgi:predicted SAM-dependent methyltransferase